MYGVILIPFYDVLRDIANLALKIRLLEMADPARYANYDIRSIF